MLLYCSSRSTKLSFPFYSFIGCLLLLSTASLVKSTDHDDASEEALDDKNGRLEFEDVTEDDAGDSIASESSVNPPKQLITYRTPEIGNNPAVYLYEPFDDEASYKRRWLQSKAAKADSLDSKYDGKWSVVPTDDRISGDYGLMMNSKARHHAIASKLAKPFKFDGTNLVVQYDVQFRNGQECGGAYLKLLSSGSGDLTQLTDKSPYSIMFGPDKCGNDHKLHFIFNHKNKKTGKVREIHWKKAASASGLSEVITDGKWHHFRLMTRPDNTFEISIDRKVIGKGSLLEDFEPPVNLPKMIDDPEDKKPEDWDEREKIPDPETQKPEDWDENEPRKIPDENAQKPSDWNEEEPEMIPDPEAKKPEDWSEEMDGEWEPPLINNPNCTQISGCGPWKAPLVDNPKYKGKWKPPLIPNPNYQGKWAPRKIPNPEYHEDLTPYKMIPFDAVAFELWTISDGIVFDNVLITSDVDVANMVADNTFLLKKDIGDERDENWFQNMIRTTNKKPWLWAVYVLAVLVPIMLLIGKFTRSKKEKHQDGNSGNRSNVGGDEGNESESEKPGPSGVSKTTRQQPSEFPSSSEKPESGDTEAKDIMNVIEDIMDADTEEDEVTDDNEDRDQKVSDHTSEEEIIDLSEEEPEPVGEKDTRMKTRSRRAIRRE